MVLWLVCYHLYMPHFNDWYQEFPHQMHWDVLIRTLTSYCLNQDQYGGIRKYCFDSLQRRHNEHDGVWNHQPYDCLLNYLFRRRTKKTSKLRVTGLCEGNLPVNSAQEGPVRQKCFHLMTSSCEVHECHHLSNYEQHNTWIPPTVTSVTELG